MSPSPWPPWVGAWDSTPWTTDAISTIAAGTDTGAVIQLKGLGVPKLRGRGRGDLFVHVSVDTPTGLDDRQKELLFALAEARGEELGDVPHSEGIFSKLRSALS